MFASLNPLPDDPILKLIVEFRDDPRPDKVDLGVGVYRDEAGVTPVFGAVKAAEKRVWEAQETKGYLGLRGDPEFCTAMENLVLAGAAADRRTSVQCVAGSGALALLLQLSATANPDATFWLSDPTWPNHPWMVEGVEGPMRTYAYFDPATRMLRRDAMFADLAAVGAGDVVLLHGCCHNPTGANLTIEDWSRLADMAIAQGFIPFVDFAYQGFGDGLEEDAAGVRLLAERVPEVLIAVSCSKNFALYRDRAGVAIVTGSSAAQAEVVLSNLMALHRQTVSMPPDHGAAVVKTILADAELSANWRAELSSMQARMLSLREGLAGKLRERANDNRFDFIADHRGMFSLLGCSLEQAEALKRDHGVYVVGDGRINIAGLSQGAFDKVADAFIAVGL
ncbi:MAG: amino acid aminotransferase [Pseudomonadota bacterium]